MSQLTYYSTAKANKQALPRQAYEQQQRPKSALKMRQRQEKSVKYK